MSAWLCFRMDEAMLDEGFGRPRVLTELVAALLLPRVPKSGSLDRDRPVDEEREVRADDEACRCLGLIRVDVEVDKPRLVDVLRLREACRSNLGLGAGGSRGA